MGGQADAAAHLCGLVGLRVKGVSVSSRRQSQFTNGGRALGMEDGVWLFVQCPAWQRKEMVEIFCIWCPAWRLGRGGQCEVFC